MRDRTSVLEYAVFGLAGLLAAILAYHAYARWIGGRRPAPQGPLSGSEQPPRAMGAPADDGAGQSESFRSSGGLPPVRLPPLSRKPKR